MDNGLNLFNVHKRISLDDEGYSLYKKSAMSRNKNESFGGDILENLNVLTVNLDAAQGALEKQVEKVGNNTDEVGDEYFKIFKDRVTSAEKEQQEFLAKNIGLNRLKKLINSLNEAWNNRQITKDIKTSLLLEFIELFKPIIAKDKVDEFLPTKTIEDTFDSAVKIISFINSGNLSIENSINILKFRQDYMNQKESEFEQKIEQYKNDFKRDVENAVNEGKLPLNILDNVDRISNVSVKLVDWLENIDSQTMGWVHNGKGGVVVDSRFLHEAYAKKLKHVVYHEFVHIINGVSVNKYEQKDKASREAMQAIYGHDGSLYKTLKSGLLMKSSLGGRRIHNKWLNEATTELTTLILLGEDESIDLSSILYYRDEMKTLYELFDKGLDRMDVLNAYFENVTKEQPVGEKGVRMVHLIKEMNRIDSGSYVRVDNEYELDYLADKLEGIGLYTEEEYIRQGAGYEDSVIFKFQAGLNDKTSATKSFVFTKHGAENNSLKNVLRRLKLIEKDLFEIKGIKIIDTKIVSR
jgi:hypothetical protein